MFIACHLLFGLVLGLALARHLGDRRLIGFSALGAVLPDLIDKPVGHILLADSLDSGRIFAHGLLFLVLLLALGIAVERRQGSFALLAVAAGGLSHQVLDTMWTLPVTWCFPLLGPYQPYEYTNYFGNALLAEASSLSEWVFLFASAGIALTACWNPRPDLLPAARKLVSVSIPLLGLLALASLYAWAAGLPESILMTGGGPEDCLMLGLVGAVGVAGTLRYRDLLNAGQSRQ
ncbi:MULTISPECIES: metal-dependent hydrolase [unclassified Methanoculleus]|uniref:metal-dependent hydrolase n=1 Tax=unclassified Methanoculleus TaxID=2619537 RepID=UPI0025FEBC59|nr:MULTISPECIES: metal-dependent hydrolase [unclassified Methanoculleus]MCK9317074.1 metal-dependent hydrolase [Methanoculleus sp.]MDD2253435.1 metal-dependent hydrolase [Methanoculleus sp.]MDD2788722.1 metal-dependent hydrolase [Methanoculleus sp.]MDD3214986.1 metal-dependent hydrolase [Methanoculleus sp.]MDD4313960.1 metal-dependent hydrolase [Methanoculleus sp.]